MYGREHEPRTQPPHAQVGDRVKVTTAKIHPSFVKCSREKKNEETAKHFGGNFKMFFHHAATLWLSEPGALSRTHPCSQAAVVLVVTVLLLEARARAVVFLLHEPVVDALPRQAGIDYKTVAWNTPSALSAATNGIFPPHSGFPQAVHLQSVGLCAETLA